MIDARVRQAVQQRLDTVVELAKGCVEETGIATSKMEKSQLHNLRNIAHATDSLKALENFICYQMGRHKDEWLQTGFGKHVLEDLERLRHLAGEITRETGASEDMVCLELIRLYTGFLYRWFVAEQAVREGGKGGS